MAVLLLPFGLVLTGCDGDDSENADPKTLAITSIPAELDAQGQNGVSIEIFPPGTETSRQLTCLVAGAYNAF
ncbi:MAG: hypothetical protein LBH85_02950 [Treponema sp.]|jgi:hypothetical protein|nr:hypothetical protein [Treponema sp.]